MRVQSYLFFNGRCDEALAFYASAIGATTTFITRFGDAPEGSSNTAPDWADKVMHANFEVGNTQLMASDGQCALEGDASMRACSLSIEADSQADAERMFNALVDGGTVTMPFQSTFWSSGFGMLVDRFGVKWMVSAPA
ncbi:hypothetical protein IGB42_00714 [Andreprevotia sp. IGB-42]|uniref:VOC family protein n=1 Tax=Andreprevotia sp. IGB-42 TaxID=2497473 RepID=UPI001359558D|nr:VOC family protein [Andreprevotia sp. IGB-42]KAF0814659.1 hypothetical protein IGB42_00714 [Andreprevotia sp. IGB-42]